LVGEAQVEQQQLVLEAARAEYAAAETNLRRLEQSLEFQQRQAEAELTSAQLARSLAEKGTGIESIERRVDIARLQLQQTRILAPMDAVVLTVAAHPGELVAQQPILQLADLQHLTCVAEVEASDVSAIAPGHKAIIRSRALGEHEL